MFLLDVPPESKDTGRFVPAPDRTGYAALAARLRPPSPPTSPSTASPDSASARATPADVRSWTAPGPGRGGTAAASATTDTPLGPTAGAGATQTQAEAEADQRGPWHRRSPRRYNWRVTTHELVVADATLRGRPGRWQLGLDQGRITLVTEEPMTGRDEIDAAGGLVTESFVDGHLHLDKVHTLDRAGDAALTAYTAGDMGSALRSIELASAVKADYDRSWIEPNARRAVLQAVRFGVRHVLAFADVDTSARLEGVIPLLALRDESGALSTFRWWRSRRTACSATLVPRSSCARRSTSAPTSSVASRGSSTPTPRRASTYAGCACSPPRTAAASPCGGHAGDATLHTTEMLAEAMVEHGLVARGIAQHARAAGSTPALRSNGSLPWRAARGSDSSATCTPGRSSAGARAHCDGASGRARAGRHRGRLLPLRAHNMAEVAFLGAHALEAVDTAGIDLVYDAVTTTAATGRRRRTPARGRRQRRPRRARTPDRAVGAGPP